VWPAGVVKGYLGGKVAKVIEVDLHLQVHKLLAQKVIVVSQDRQGHQGVRDHLEKTDCPDYPVC